MQLLRGAWVEFSARVRRQATREGHRARRRALVGAQRKRTMGRARPDATAMARLGRQRERNHPGLVDNIACRPGTTMRPPSCRARTHKNGRFGGVDKGTAVTDECLRRERPNMAKRLDRLATPSRASSADRPRNRDAAPRINQRESEHLGTPVAPASSTSTRNPASMSNSAARAPAAPVRSPARQSCPHRGNLVRGAPNCGVDRGTAGAKSLLHSHYSITDAIGEPRKLDRRVVNRPKIRHRERLGAAHSVMIPEIYNSASSTLMTASDSASTSSLLMSGLT